MTVNDIETALDSRDLAAIEAAFRTLIQWPDADTVDDAEDARELSALLDRVTAALEADRHPMPEDLVAAIITGTSGGSWLRDDRSYAAGARAVAASSLQWTAMFNARLGLGDENISTVGIGPR